MSSVSAGEARSSAAASVPRDLFLDAIRAVAVIRVVAWHTFGWAPLTWVVSAVPAMIFVSGHLLAQSYARRPVRVVLADRLQRLLVPFWAFGAAAWTIMIGARLVRDIPETRLPWRSLPLWILPVNDPRGSVWEGGWLSQPLWYLRVLLLLLVVSPLLLHLVRQPAKAASALVAVTIALELWQRQAEWHPAWAPDLVFRAGDATLYAAFFVLGMANQRATLPLRRTAHWLASAAACGLAAIVFARALHPLDGVANNSHTVHFFVGATWLSLAFAGRSLIARVAAARVARPAIAAIGRRSLTIYLWHAGCAITVWHLLAEIAPLPRGVHSTLLGVGTAVLTAAVVLMVGPIEDLAAGRLGPRPQASRRLTRATGWTVRLTGITLVVVCLALVVPDGRGHDLAAPSQTVASSDPDRPTPPTTNRRPTAPRVPSQAPRRPVFDPTDGRTATATAAGNTGGAVTPSTSTRPAVAPATEPWSPESTPPAAPLADALDEAVARWTATWGIPGIRIAVARPDVFAWKQSYGVDWDDSPLQVDQAIDFESITKTFTATLAWQLIAEGVLTVDAALPSLASVPEFPADTYTLDELLRHRSGIPDYHDTGDFAPDDRAPIDRAIASALLAPQVNAPGAAQYYSSTNYLIIGRYLEQVTGTSLDTLLDERIFVPNGIRRRYSHAPSTDQAPGGGAAGVVGDLDSLLVWGDVLLRLHLPVGDDAFHEMARLSEATSLGAGLYGYCPCVHDELGQPVWQRIGHSGGTTSLQYAPAFDIVVAFQVPSGVWGDHDLPLEALIETLIDIIDAYPF